MRHALVVAAFLLLSPACQPRPAEEESVVSVYTTLPSAGGAGAHLDVYRQIADNLAQRVAQPFYRFFGINSTQDPPTTARPFEHIELTPDKPSNNSNRDVEELSPENTHKTDKKPEKFTLFSSYLPVKSNLEINETDDSQKTNDVDTNDINTDTDDDDSLELDDVESDDEDDGSSGRGGPFVYILELMGSIIQLLWGGFLAIFKPSTDGERRAGS